MRIVLLLEMVILVYMVVATVSGCRKEEKQNEPDIAEKIQSAETIDDLQFGAGVLFKDIDTKQTGLKNADVFENEQADHAELKNMDVFKNIPTDYIRDVEGFVYYEIPEEYRKAGGYFPITVQKYTYSLCKQEGVRYALILAMTEWESDYQFDAVGDDGVSVGYLQIGEKWHKERMQKVGATDLFNPYENIRVGVDYIKELIDKYGTIQDALAAYNYGEKGALRHLWNKGIFQYEYNETIMRRMKEIEEELGI